MAYLLIIGGLVAAALGVFAWPMMKKLPTHRARSGLFGNRAAQAMMVAGGLIAAGAGVLIAVVGGG